MSVRAALRSAARELAGRSFHFARWYFAPAVRQEARLRAESVIVYQMGKVGSRTVVKTLEAHGYHAHHVHQLTAPQIDAFEDRVRRAFRHRIGTGRSRINAVRHLLRCRQLADRIEGRKSVTPVNVVTLVRDPVARNVSELFELIDLFIDYGLEERLREGWSPGEVGRDLARTYLSEYDRHDAPMEFFDRLEDALGIDVYARPFPKEKGFAVYERGEIRLLVIRLESLDQRFREAFETLLDDQLERLIRDNVTESESHPGVYRRYREELELSDGYLDRMYGSTYARHFYTEEEIASFRSAWTGGTGETGGAAERN